MCTSNLVNLLWPKNHILVNNGCNFSTVVNRFVVEPETMLQLQLVKRGWFFFAQVKGLFPILLEWYIYIGRERGRIKWEQYVFKRTRELRKSYIIHVTLLATEVVCLAFLTMSYFIGSRVLLNRYRSRLRTHLSLQTWGQHYSGNNISI